MNKIYKMMIGSTKFFLITYGAILLAAITVVPELKPIITEIGAVLIFALCATIYLSKNW